MPETEAVPVGELSPQEMTQQLSRLTRDWNWDSYIPSDRVETVEQIEKMLDDDAICAQALRFVSNIVINLVGEYEHPDERIQEFVRTALHQTAGSFQALRRWLLRAQLLGFALAEKVWKQIELDRRGYNDPADEQVGAVEEASRAGQGNGVERRGG